MADSIYAYVDKFPELDSKFPESSINSDTSNKQDCEAFKTSSLSGYEGSEKKTNFVNKCTNIINHLDTIQSKPSSKFAYFKYINYWLYDTLKDMKPFLYDELLNEFYNKITKFKDYQTYKNHINEEIYNELNQLYKLYENLNKYKTGLSESSPGSCVHANECANLYESHVRKCRWGYNPEYCTSLEKFRKVYEKHSSQENKCLVKMQYLTPVGHNPVANFLNVTLAMSIITFVFIYFYKFTSFGSWLRPRLPGGKNKTKKLEKKMEELKNTPEVRNSPYTVPYHSS